MSRRQAVHYIPARERYAVAVERPLPKQPLWRRALAAFWRWC